MANDGFTKNTLLEAQALTKSVEIKDSKIIIQSLKKCQVLYSNKSYEEAIRELREILKAYPQYVDCHYMLANVLRESGSNDGAISEYTIVLTTKPDAGIYNDLGDCYTNKKEHNAAVRAYVNAIRMKDSPQFRKNLNDALEKLGLQPKEIKEFSSQIQRFSSPADVHASLGDLFFRRPSIDDAMQEYIEAIELNPDHLIAHDGLGNCFYMKKDYDSALEEYACALFTQPDFADGHYHLANVYYRMDRVDEAIKEYIESIYRKTNNSYAHYYLGKCYYKKGRLDEAIKEYRKATLPHAEGTELLNGLGKSFSTKGLIDIAVNEYKKALLDAAIKEHRKADLPNNEDAELFYDFGKALSNKGLINDAITEYKKAIKIKPDYKDALIEINKLLQIKASTSK